MIFLSVPKINVHVHNIIIGPGVYLILMTLYTYGQQMRVTLHD